MSIGPSLDTVYIANTQLKNPENSIGGGFEAP